MPIFEVLCLANSRKNSGRCIAGLRTDGHGWIRPVSSKTGATLSLGNYRLDCLNVPKIFDIIRIEFEEHCPLLNQPENWLISDKTWNLISRPAPIETIKQLITNSLNKRGTLLGNYSDRINYNVLIAEPSKESLTLLRPQNLHWKIQSGITGKRQTRAVFSLGNTKYDLVITDPEWEDILAVLPPGLHPARSVHLDEFEPEQLLFTVSLGEPFNGDCYKLVAGIIELNLFNLDINSN
ncbi:hypothetical protein NUACC21_67870 [Scytonema sp. NUACC21]